jgi:hypothetical protein
MKTANQLLLAATFLLLQCSTTLTATEPKKSEAKATEAQSPETHKVLLRFVGGEKQIALAGVEVTLTNGYGSQQKKFGPFKTDKDGAAEAALPAGFYSIYLDSAKPLPFLSVDMLWNKETRGHSPDLSLYITPQNGKIAIQKWLRGKARAEGTEAPTADRPARLTYTLLPACELILHAVDADTGKPLAGATFYTECAVCEDWARDIDNANIGGQARAPAPDKEKGSQAKPAATEKAGGEKTEAVETTSDKSSDGKTPDDKSSQDAMKVFSQPATDASGILRRLVTAKANYTYGPMQSPPGYEPVPEFQEVELAIAYGQAKAEHTFKFRKKAKQ